MKLFVVKATGRYALEIKVIRAENEANALAMAMAQLAGCEIAGDFYDKVTVIELSTEGDSAVLAEASYLE